MPNLNKHRKAITEAGYTLSKDGTQVTNKEGKTVAGTNDNGFFSGSSTLTKIFKGDTKAKEKAPAKSSKKAPAKTAAKTSKRPPSKKTDIKDMAEKAIDATPKSSTGGRSRYKSTKSSTGGPARYKSASPNNLPHLTDLPTNTTPAPEPAKKGILRNAQGKNIAGGSWGRLLKRQDKLKDTQKAPATTITAEPETPTGGTSGTINGVTFAKYEKMSLPQRKAADLPLNLNKRSWETRIMTGGST